MSSSLQAPVHNHNLRYSLHITLLFDKDERGAKFVRESIEVAHKRGISVLVATFPDGESLSDGRPIHDIDEYLQAHTPQELHTLLEKLFGREIPMSVGMKMETMP